MFGVGMLRFLLLLLLVLPITYATIQVNPPQPVIELDNTYLWVHINNSNATRMNLTHNGVTKKVSTIENNISNVLHTFNYANDNWGDWQIELTTGDACLHDPSPRGTACENFDTDDVNMLCDDGYTCSVINDEFLINSPPNLNTINDINWRYYGTCGFFLTPLNVSFYLNGVHMASVIPQNHCTCDPPIADYPAQNITFSGAVVNSTWIHNGVNNITAKSVGGSPCYAGIHAILNMTFDSGNEIMESRTITVGKFNMTETSDTCTESAINYPCIKSYDIHYDGTVPQEYRHISTGDDLGSFRANTHVIENMTNLDNKNRMFLWEYGARFFVFDLVDFFNGIRFDYNDIDYGLWHAGMTPHWYELNSTHWWLGSTDYYGITKVGLWNGTTDTAIFTSADEGNTHGEGVWCDILPEGGDGVPEWIITEEAGTLIMYNATADNSTFTEAFQSSDYGSSSWGNDVLCADINNDGKDDVFTQSADGKLVWFNASGTSITEHKPATDYGSFYAKPWAGDIDGDGLTEIIYGNTDGTVSVMYWDEATSNFVAQWTSADMGYMYHDQSITVIDINRDGKLDIVTNDYYNDLYVCLQNSATSYTCTNHYNYNYLSYNREICAKDREGFCHFVKSSGYTPTQIIWDWYMPTPPSANGNFKLIDRQDNYFYKFSDAWSSESTGYTVDPFAYDFDNDGDEEIMLTATMGYMLYYDYINYSSFELKLNYSRQLGIVQDYMSRTPETHLIGNKVHCYNDINIALGKTEILLETGSAPANKQRLTDGLVSSDIDNPFEQGSADYITMTSGINKWIELNLTETYNVGKVKFVGYFHDNRHIQNLSMAVSSDRTTWTTIFNATDEPWLNQGNHKMGVDVYFQPQGVQYIRVYESGYQDNYDGGAWASSNHITELEVYEGNNCSFMFVPLEERGAKSADVGISYDITVDADKNEDYRIKYDMINQISSSLNSMARYIIEWVT